MAWCRCRTSPEAPALPSPLPFLSLSFAFLSRSSVPSTLARTLRTFHKPLSLAGCAALTPSHSFPRLPVDSLRAVDSPSRFGHTPSFPPPSLAKPVALALAAVWFETRDAAERGFRLKTSPHLGASFSLTGPFDLSCCLSRSSTRLHPCQTTSLLLTLRRRSHRTRCVLISFLLNVSAPVDLWPRSLQTALAPEDGPHADAALSDRHAQLAGPSRGAASTRAGAQCALAAKRWVSCVSTSSRSAGASQAVALRRLGASGPPDSESLTPAQADARLAGNAAPAGTTPCQSGARLARLQLLRAARRALRPMLPGATGSSPTCSVS